MSASGGECPVSCATAIRPQQRNVLACIIHEDSASRANSAKQVALSPEKRGPPRAEGDRVRCDALSAQASDRQSVILRLTVKSLETLQIKTQKPNSPVDS